MSSGHKAILCSNELDVTKNAKNICDAVFKEVGATMPAVGHPEIRQGYKIKGHDMVGLVAQGIVDILTSADSTSRLLLPSGTRDMSMLWLG